MPDYPSSFQVAIKLRSFADQNSHPAQIAAILRAVAEEVEKCHPQASTAGAVIHGPGGIVGAWCFGNKE